MNTITLLSQADCSLCEHAKEVLARLQTESPFAVEEVSITSDAGKAMAVAAGVLFAPGIYLNGQPFGYGRLSERKLRKALAAAHPATA